MGNIPQKKVRIIDDTGRQIESPNQFLTGGIEQYMDKNQSTDSVQDEYTDCCYSECSGFSAYIMCTQTSGGPGPPYYFYGNSAGTIVPEGCSGGCSLLGGSLYHACVGNQGPPGGDDPGPTCGDWTTCSCVCEAFVNNDCDYPGEVVSGRFAAPPPKLWRSGGKVRRRG